VRGWQSQIVNIVLSQAKLKRLTCSDVPSSLGSPDDAVVKLDYISEVETSRRRRKHKQNVAFAPRIAVWQGQV
jgi:hypothetical protein